jgi:hypothetical protein
MVDLTELSPSTKISLIVVFEIRSCVYLLQLPGLLFMWFNYGKLTKLTLAFLSMFTHPLFFSLFSEAHQALSNKKEGCLT